MARIAIAGNPNAGKTTIFNDLTGTVQAVSNYPGVTVERKEGVARFKGRRFTVVDLPGTYSLTAYSQEEIVARDYVIEEKPDVVIDVVDASNLERNLYLAIQLMEMGAPLVIALNMIDVARKRGFAIDAKRLGELLGAPVFPTVGSKGEGVDAVMEACAAVAHGTLEIHPREVTYGPKVDRVIDDLAVGIERVFPDQTKYPPRWLAVKLIESDDEVAGRLRALDAEAAETALAAAERAIREIEKQCEDDAATIVAERRYGYAAGAIKECLTLHGQARQDRTDAIDAVVCNKAVGPLILLAVVAALFFFVFKLSDEWRWIPWWGGRVTPVGWFEFLFAGLSEAVAPLEGPTPMLHSLLSDAIIGGVGGVIGFTPIIFFMFLFISVLEDSGYIARVAFLLDRVLRAFGLQGKSILAMIVSGGLGASGCAVPGVMATRTLREEKDRLVTMLVAPFMNCGAKMPVYAMLIAAFFSEGRTRMMLLLWAISWAVALCAAWFLRRFVIRGEQTPFVMELPPYHLPTARAVLLHTWERTWMYVKKAGTIILAVNVVLWAFMYFPRYDPQSEAAAISGAPAPATMAKGTQETKETKGTEGTEGTMAGPGPVNPLGPLALSEAQLSERQLAHSFAGRAGRALEPVTRLAGFDWRTNIALIGGFAAKEVVVGTLGTVYAMGDVDPDAAESLSARLAADPQWDRLRAFAMMLFVMIYAPCFVTMAVIARESHSWKWALFSTAFSTTLAFLLATAVYQIGYLMGWGA